MNEHDKILRLGLDVGSTTAKMVLIDDSDKAVMTGYERHNADTRNVIRKFLTDIRSRFP